MLRNAADSEGERLFHHPVGLEFIAVGQTSDQTAFAMFIKAERAGLALGPAEALVVLRI